MIENVNRSVMFLLIKYNIILNIVYLLCGKNLLVYNISERVGFYIWYSYSLLYV